MAKHALHPKTILRLTARLFLLLPLSAGAAESVCYGTTSKGRVEGAVQIPESGSNFVPYSRVGVSLGRTFVHSKVERVITAAYAALAPSAPKIIYMYGESGRAGGGPLKPHRTHQNGLAVDFMVPVLNAQGTSVALPTSTANKFGYSIEFDAAARYQGLSIDFEAIAEHLYAIHTAAKQQGIGVARVIFEPAYLPQLYKTQRGAFIKQHIPFMQKPAWVRHDEHYHIDFSISCKPMSS